MKKPLTHFTYSFVLLAGLMLFSSSLIAQSIGNIKYYVLDQNASPISGATVMLEVGPPTSPTIYTYYTNNNGFFTDSIPVNGSGNITASISTSNCFDSTTFVYQQSIGIFNLTDTLHYCFSKCAVNPVVTPSATNPYTYTFTHQKPFAWNTHWDFGDGNISNVASPTHTYSGPGSYVYCVFVDSCNIICDTLVVPPAPNAIPVIVYLNVFNQLQGSVGNFNVNVIDNSVSPPNSYTYTTNSNGWLYDTIMVQGTGQLDCFVTQGGCSDSSIFSFNPNTAPNTYWNDTLHVCTPSNNCNIQIFASQLLSSNSFGFSHSDTTALNTLWDFGDGTTSNQLNTNHTYANPGTYIFCATVDSCPTVCDTLVIGNSPSSCQASFIIDTVNSQPGSLVVWNTSIPNNNPNTQYLWDFGDGNTSTQPFPTHTYNGAGTYVLCLGINIPATATSGACSSLYCDTLKVDSLGNLIQKSTGSTFQLNVLDPTTISINEFTISKLKLFPNPTQNEVNISFNAPLESDFEVSIYDLSGREILQENTRSLKGSNAFQLKLDAFEKGIYLVHIKIGNNRFIEKLLVN